MGRCAKLKLRYSVIRQLLKKMGKWANEQMCKIKIEVLCHSTIA